MTEERTHHPFHIYEAIQSEPDAFARVVARSAALVDPWAARLAACDRLFLVGAGTSHHAAQVGEHLLRAYGGNVRPQAVHSFDFAHYGPHLTPRDGVIAISHRASGGCTIESLERARSAGCLTALIAGEGTSRPDSVADIVLPTVPLEKPYPHTVSYVGAVAVLAAITERIGVSGGVATPLTTSTLETEVPAAMRRALECEDEVAELARAHAGARLFWCVGGGPGAATAQEIALKIKEMAYRPSEGLGVEALLHGPLLAAQPEDVFLLIAPAGAAQRRILELAAMLVEIGAPHLVVSDGTPTTLRDRAAGWVVVPPVPEALTTLTCLIPLQLFAYHLALALGANPDRSRLIDPRFARAYQRTAV